MFRPRVIPVILVDERGHAVKTVRFKKPLDLGDSVNTVSLFNAFEVDELVVLDISASRLQRRFTDRLMADLASEAQMPLAVGGGIRTIEDVHALLEAGAEKVIISTAALARPQFVRDAAEQFGSSSITVCLDLKRDWRGRPRTSLSLRGSKSEGPAHVARLMEEMGAGELIVQSVDQDGRMSGYDLELIGEVADAVGIPVVALGGAGTFEHIREANQKTQASAFASGSLFCFQDTNRGVLVSYPGSDDLATLATRS
ncbi:HisA/HisF-related TIM barrel protein [Novosphingopyxis sp. YJ-S2-01]|uniref:HisA/HisF-related TIM barrel protein n=1 Tax=Novosphingopyxis sp. YJ-S2-01 TaxID=2794021 RepID=UPI0018DB0531|nr:HisA/HisF-related TIM barrel protein [Novosphingopyxis sp. YJ-S2-01]MBH9538448.1 imidazole glycerol phosphate synthase subunit HisF [Novosphingopyxis sp. YJ-S2-01]